MSNFGFGEMFSNVSRSVINSAINAATSSAQRAMDPFAVHEISGKANLEEVASYPVKYRSRCLLLYGTIPAGRFNKTRLSPFQIILHVPNSERMFSMLRTENEREAESTFVVYKESIPLLAECDPSICDLNTLEKMANKLRHHKGWAAPHLAASLSLMNCLKHKDMVDKLNLQEEDCLMTPLMVAIDQGNSSVVSELLAMGVDCTIKDIKDNTVFHIAANKSPAIFQLLLDKLPVEHHNLLNHVNVEGFTPLHAACNNNNAELVKALLGAGADSSVSSTLQGYPIHVAVKSKSVSCLQELVAKNPSQLHMKDLQDGGSPLHWATGPETMIPLLDLGCDPNIQDDNGYTPLHNAVRRGCVKSTIYLLCHGAFPNLKGGEEEETPLHIASKLCSRVPMQALISFGSDINMTNKHGDTARHVVATSLRSDKDSVLYILTGVGAKRCSPDKSDRCVDGCSHSGSFNGNIPLNFPVHGSVNLMHEALNAYAIQKFASDRAAASPTTTSNAMDVDSSPNHLDYKTGGRLLCLDGGGIRGVVLTQMLMVIEEEFNEKIVDMFDWVAGTSTGGILALALACGKSALETQCIYMRLKDKVFVGERPYSGAVMEEFLKKEFGCETTMGDIQKPKVMIMTALVDRRPADLHIFRNYISPNALIGEMESCQQEHSTQHVWEAAKVTGAAPSYFRLDHDKFVDGGLIANNPTLDALSEMHQFYTVMRSLGYFKTRQKIPTIVCSLGTGIQPRTESQASLLDITWPSGILDAITKVPRLASLINLLIDQATQSEGQVVERSRAWCSSIGVPFFRFSPQMSTEVDLDEKSDEKLIQLLWETRCYMVANKGIIIDLRSSLVENIPTP